MVTNSMSESTKQSASSQRRLNGLKNLSLRITTIFTLVVVIGLLLSLFHVLGFLFSVILLLFVIQNWMRTRRNYIRNFNSALRTTIEINGSIEKTARAFSMSGPLRSRCKRYADRLSQGDDPLVAAAHCRVPLEIQTAMAFSIPQKRTGLEKTRISDTELGNRVTGQSSSLAITSQLYYILFVCIAIVICTTFYNVFITPTMQMLMEDFDITAVVEQSYDTEEILIPYTGQGNSWPQWASALVAMGIAFGTLMFYLIAVVGIFPALITASWIPLLPVVAARKGAILNGLADAIDAGVPLKDFCELGLITFWHGKRRPFVLALNSITQGHSETSSITKAGWIKAADCSLLENSNPQRMSENIRNIARQNITRANANLSWFLAVMFPASIFCLAAAVAPYTATLFTELNALTLILSEPR